MTKVSLPIFPSSIADVIVKVSVTIMEGTTQTGGGGGKHGTKRVLLGFGVFVLVAVIAIGAGAGMRWWQQQKDREKAATPQAVSKQALDAQDLALTGNYDGAHQALDKALNNSSLSNNEKYELLLQKGLTYESQQKYDQALDSYKKAESARQTMVLAESIARVAREMGNEALAIEYYKKAIPLIPPDEPRRESIKRNFEEWISRLEAQP